MGLLLWISSQKKQWSLPNTTPQQLYQRSSSTPCQQHQLDGGLESSCTMAMQVLTKLVKYRPLLMTMASFWLGIHSTHLTLPPVISGSSQKSIPNCLEGHLPGFKILLKLKNQSWEYPHVGVPLLLREMPNEDGAMYRGWWELLWRNMTGIGVAQGAWRKIEPLWQTLLISPRIMHPLLSCVHNL